MMEELKSCPFCGNKVEVEKIPMWYGNGHGYYGCYEFKIKCKNCGCTVDQPQNDSIYRSEEEARGNAIKAWNRRAEQRWIPVSEKAHPDLPIRVQVQMDNGWIITAYYQDDEWLSVPDCEDAIHDEGIEAWRELPEPWRGEGVNK